MHNNSEFDTPFCRLLDIKYPIIVAPMFLVSNTKMVIEAIKAGATSAIPALNYRTVDELKQAIHEVQAKAGGPFGINLIVNKSNVLLEEQLNTVCEEKVDFIITSLGSPKEVIEQAHQHNVKVFCDVVDEKYAKKVIDLGADALIAVNNKAGGHAGKIHYSTLIPKLKQLTHIPIINAGGVGSGKEMKAVMEAGADGLSIGSIFIASEEADVSQAYKEACVNYGAEDIVMTTKISGTPCTVINTPYVQEIGTKQNWLERLLNKNKTLKKWFKMLTFIRGMRKLKKAAFGATYKTVWCAGPSISHVDKIRSIKGIINKLIDEYQNENK